MNLCRSRRQAQARRARIAQVALTWQLKNMLAKFCSGQRVPSDLTRSFFVDNHTSNQIGSEVNSSVESLILLWHRQKFTPERREGASRRVRAGVAQRTQDR